MSVFFSLHLNFALEDIRKYTYIYINKLKPTPMHFNPFVGEVVLCIIAYHDLGALLRLKKLLVPIPICLVHLLCT